MTQDTETSGRMLIVKVKRQDQTTADLFAPRRRFPDLKLFELAMLGVVGIDFENLQVGVETPCLFYATWETGEKLNQHGNPYKDIIALEPYDGLHSAADETAEEMHRVADSLQSVAATLRIMAQMLAAIMAHQGIDAPKIENQEPEPKPAKKVLRYGDGTDLSGNDAEKAAFKLYVQAHQGDLPDNVEKLRTWFTAHQKAQKEPQEPPIR